MLILNSKDARRGAQRRLPRILFDYLDGSASDEATAQKNVSDFAKVELRQRVLRDVSERSARCKFLGEERPTPLVLGPIGFAGAFRYDGEVLAARAAHKLGIPYCLSMFSICSISRLRSATSGELWMQLYITKDRSISSNVASTARAKGVETLVVTVDTPAGAYRERDVRSGMRGATRLTPKILVSLGSRPTWCLNMLRGGIPRFENVASAPQLGRHAFDQAAKLASQIDASFDWNELRRIRDAWRGKVVLKGILDPDDARLAASVGVDAIVVSNHGGRQLDHVPSSISRLPAIAAAVDSRIDVLLDSGVRRGGDVVKAIALGAKGVLVGRPYAFAVAADGKRGVENLLRGWLSEIDSTLAHIGESSLATVSCSNVGRALQEVPHW